MQFLRSLLYLQTLLVAFSYTMQIRSIRGKNVLKMSEVVFETAKVVSNKREANGLRAIDIEVPKSLASTYTVPGQYVQIKADPASKAGFFAVRSPPDGRDILSFIGKISNVFYSYVVDTLFI